MLGNVDMNIPDVDRAAKALQIAEWFGSDNAYDRFRTHSRPIRYPELQSVGLRLRRLEDNDQLQDAVLSIFHANEITFSGGPTTKMIENHVNRRLVILDQNIVIQPQPPAPQPQQSPHLTRQQRRALERQGRK